MSTDQRSTMVAAWYDRQGPAAEVLQAGELPAPRPSDGEVRVAVSLSGVSPGDTKKREGWRGSPMPYPRVMPQSDATGIIDAVGAGVDDARIGERVWVFGAQSYRPFGTAAQLTVVPAAQSIALPDQVSDETGAALGIPGITAHRAVFGDGPVTGKRVLVQGVLGAGLARWVPRGTGRWPPAGDHPCQAGPLSYDRQPAGQDGVPRRQARLRPWAARATPGAADRDVLELHPHRVGDPSECARRVVRA